MDTLYTKTTLVEAANAILEQEQLKLINERFVTDNIHSDMKEGREVRFNEGHLQEVLALRRAKKEYGMTRKAFSQIKSLSSSGAAESAIFDSLSYTSSVPGLAETNAADRELSMGLISGASGLFQESPTPASNSPSAKALAALQEMAPGKKGLLSGSVNMLRAAPVQAYAASANTLPTPSVTAKVETWTTWEPSNGVKLQIRADTLQQWSASDEHALLEVIRQLKKV